MDDDSITHRGFKTAYMSSDELQPIVLVGDLIEMDRGLYQHWAMAVNRLTDESPVCIVHVWGNLTTAVGALFTGRRRRVADVTVQTMSRVTRGRRARINNSIDLTRQPYSTGREMVDRAMSRLGEHNFDMFERNCEHFVAWSRNGHGESRQPEKMIMETNGVNDRLLRHALEIGSPP